MQVLMRVNLVKVKKARKSVRVKKVDGVHKLGN